MVYFRPHRAGLYPDALQYAPVFNGETCWQLFSGPGYTSNVLLPENRWVHLRLEVKDDSARIFLDDATEPALVIPHLAGGRSRGGIGLRAPTDGTAFFSRFRYRPDDTLDFGPPPEPATPPNGLITDWEISRPFPTARVNHEAYPRFYTVFLAEWRAVKADRSGLVNLSRLVNRTSPETGTVFARTIFNAEQAGRLKLSLGYSDQITVFMNGTPVFQGNSAYRSRDPSFAGVIGQYDAMHLPVRKGLNEIFLIVSDTFGGWGFLASADQELAPPVRQHERLEKIWETDAVFLTPESVLYDRDRRVLYVSSFDNMFSQRETPIGFLSKVGLDGEIENLHWVTDLNGPCGMALVGKKLYVVERGNLTEIDVETGQVLTRYPVPESVFLNDIAADDEGTLYLSDSFPVEDRSRTSIYRFRGGRIEPWMDSTILGRVNGLLVHEGRLLVGNTADGTLKAVDLASRHVTTLGSLAAGVVDGIRKLDTDSWLVSHWEGQIYQVSSDGVIVELLDSLPDRMNTADFEYIPEESLLVIPTFMGNRLTGWNLKENK